MTAPYSIGTSGGIALIVIIAIVITLRVYRAARGTKFSTIRLYRLPAFYSLFTVIALASIALTAAEIVAAAAAFVVGIALGMRLAGKTSFSNRNGKVYYHRSPALIMLWLVSFVGRFAVEIAYPSSYYAVLAVALLLVSTTGLILGEAIQVKRSYKIYRNDSGPKGQ